MTSQISQEKKIAKKKGRPATGSGQNLGVRFHVPMIAAIDSWIAAQPDPKPSRPEAIRRLLEQALRQ